MDSLSVVLEALATDIKVDRCDLLSNFTRWSHVV